MSKKPESRRQLRIRTAIQARYGEDVFVFKVHGNEYQPAGLPDLVGVLDGTFFGFEVKEPDGEASSVQLKRIRQVQRAGGVGGVIETEEDAFDLLRQIRSQAKRGCATNPRQKVRRRIRRTEDG